MGNEHLRQILERVAKLEKTVQYLVWAVAFLVGIYLKSLFN